MNQIDLAGRCAIVTGGASGIGFAIAERFAASGARVALWDIDGEAAQRGAARLSAGAGGHLGVAVDVVDAWQATQVCETRANAALKSLVA